MGCRSDYMEQTAQEKHYQNTAKLLVYVKKALDMKINKAEKEISNEQWIPDSHGQPLVVELCSILNTIGIDRRNALMSDINNPIHRELADWWQKHEAEDKKRLKDKKEHEQEELIAQIRTKLNSKSITELKALLEGL